MRVGRAERAPHPARARAALLHERRDHADQRHQLRRQQEQHRHRREEHRHGRAEPDLELDVPQHRVGRRASTIARSHSIGVPDFQVTAITTATIRNSAARPMPHVSSRGGHRSHASLACLLDQPGLVPVRWLDDRCLRHLRAGIGRFKPDLNTSGGHRSRAANPHHHAGLGLMMIDARAMCGRNATSAMNSAISFCACSSQISALLGGARGGVAGDARGRDSAPVRHQRQRPVAPVHEHVRRVRGRDLGHGPLHLHEVGPDRQVEARLELAGVRHAAGAAGAVLVRARASTPRSVR